MTVRGHRRLSFEFALALMDRTNRLASRYTLLSDPLMAVYRRLHRHAR
jgi:hypothetical protein